MSDSLEASMMKRIGELKAENARLKEKSECQAQGIDAFDKKLREAEAEVARLKTENSGLRAGIESLERVDNKIIARLKEENEQLFFASQGSVKYVDHQMAFARQATEHHKEMDRLKAEIERLNATLQQAYVDFEERIRNEAAHPACIKLNRLVGDKNNEIARLKAELEMLKASSRGHSTSHLYQQMAEDCARLKAEVERLTYVDDFIVIQRASVVSIQEVFGPEDGPDSECNWRYFIRVDKAQYDKVLKHMEEFWSAKEGKQP